MRVKLVAGNWKMNGALATNQGLLDTIIPAISSFSHMQCVLCVPFPFLAQVQQKLHGSKIALGAQDLCEYDNGAYTGGVSAAMLADFGCRYVIVGHSERRSVFGESDAVVARKFEKAQSAGLTPILCIGETLAEREAGLTENTVARQIDAVIAHAGVKALGLSVVAYEPVWAIGTGKTATAAQAQAVHAFIRSRIAADDSEVADKLQLLYGGSVKAANSAQLFAMPDIDGGLIGGASLIAGEFTEICRSALPAA
jgi:triosephosphate isomerase